jgi:phosphatidylglycerol---prolipoprotein diacylglyceryl transferase
MYPSFEVFGLEIHFYSIFFMLGLVAGCLMIVYGNKNMKKYRSELLDCYIYIMVGIMIGAKLLYLLVNINVYINDFSRIWMDLRRGFLFYGGLIGAIISVMLYFRKKKLPFWNFVDCAAPAIPLGHAIGRIGCMFAGCCYGSPTTLPWGVVYPASCPIAPSGIALHPFPIYELLFNLLLFGFILLIRKKVKIPGRLMAIYLMGYSIERFFLDYLRGDYVKNIWVFSTAQIISIGILIAGVVLYFVLKRNKDKTLE